MDSAWIIWYDDITFDVGGGVGVLVIIGVGCLEGLLVVGLYVTGFGVGLLEGLLLVGFAVVGLLEG